ncbi:MAG: hypothetical protein ACI4UT_02960, partial [Candidatus Enteromonas sp.]
DHGISDNVSRIYQFWSSMECNILKDAAVKVDKHLDTISKRFDASKNENAELARANARDALGLLALRLAIQAQANKLLSESIINALRKDMHGEDLAKVAAEPSKKETKHENRQDAHAAERLAQIKKEAKFRENEKKKAADKNEVTVKEKPAKAKNKKQNKEE